MRFLGVVKKTNIITQIHIKSSDYTGYTNYPYEIGNGWKINNSTSTMDKVFTKFGKPTTKNTSSPTFRTYGYTPEGLTFGFFSDSEDNYTDKKIVYLTIY